MKFTYRGIKKQRFFLVSGSMTNFPIAALRISANISSPNHMPDKDIFKTYSCLIWNDIKVLNSFTLSVQCQLRFRNYSSAQSLKKMWAVELRQMCVMNAKEDEVLCVLIVTH